MAYNTTASLDKVTCTDFVDFVEGQDRYAQTSWSKNDSNYWDVKLGVSKKDDNKEVRLVQIFTMGEVDFNQIMRLWIQFVIAAENFGRKRKHVSSGDIYNVQIHA